jgi:hypothetical protein
MKSSPLDGAVGIGEESTGGVRSEATDLAPSGDSAQVIFRRRGGAEEVQRDVAELPVASACPEERRPRQIGDGGAAELAPMAAAVFCRGGAR